MERREMLSIFSLDDACSSCIVCYQEMSDENQSSASLLMPNSARRDVMGETIVTPTNLKRANQSVHLIGNNIRKQPELTASPGYRAAESFVRPAPIATAGSLASYGFDLRRCEFSLAIQAPRAAGAEAPTVVFLRIITTLRMPARSRLVRASGR